MKLNLSVNMAAKKTTFKFFKSKFDKKSCKKKFVNIDELSFNLTKNDHFNSDHF